ncbi:MAG: hypothetical protein M0P12_01050 [Paludibacteraceae bacterium]|nr:hypothetical protein [Paludibacteraceae bacterium]MCK9615203.1 hypothetical protein [Candidatus Omnitrophota bacterium]
MSIQVSYVGGDVENYKDISVEGEAEQFLTVENVKYFRTLFSFLNPKDRDILYLIFLSRKKQTEVQDILERGQSSLCYDIKQIRKRLKCISYLKSVSDIFVEFLEKDASKYFNEQEKAILTMLFFSTSYICTAEVLKMSQVKVSSTFEKCLERLLKKKIWPIYEIFYTIGKNLNIIKRTYRRNGLILDAIMD